MPIPVNSFERWQAQQTLPGVVDDYTQVLQLVSLREARSQRVGAGSASVSSSGDPSPRHPASVGAKTTPSGAHKRKSMGKGSEADQIMKRIEDDRERV
jgi:hypothetical protein